MWASILDTNVNTVLDVLETSAPRVSRKSFDWKLIGTMDAEKNVSKDRDFHRLADSICKFCGPFAITCTVYK